MDSKTRSDKMSTTIYTTPTARLRAGIARADITPPVGIYHPMWGAARHQRATGVHRPLFVDALALAPLEGNGLILRIQMDHVGMEDEQQQELIERVSAAAGLAPEQVQTTFSHSHASGNFARDRLHLPGGELIEPYLVELFAKSEEAARQAVANLQAAVITYGVGKCQLAVNRDYWDAERGIHTCGFNPDAPPADETLVVARISDPTGALLATVVNYGCHPTTLAWENTMLSPDYIGAMREVVEEATGALCIFAQGACGDLAPRWNQQGDAAVADANGRQLGYAALATLENIGPPLADFQYQGPVISGATLGDWRYRPLSLARMAATARFEGGNFTVQLPQKPLPDPMALEAEMEEWGTKQQEADERGDAIAARDYGARLERARRWLLRVRYLSAQPTYIYHFTVHRLGDGFWITTGGEPYSVLQSELRRRFPAHPILLTPLAGDFQVAYLLPSDRYGRGLYQEEPSILAPGCLEILTEAIAERIQAMV
jgi:hypothetical protein